MYELQVEGMSCNHCVAMVTRYVQEVDADAKVAVDLAAHTVAVDSRAGIEQIKSAITEAGYEVRGSRTIA